MLIPNHGAQLGNFGVVNASAGETWVMTAEGMRANAAQRDDLTQSERMGADNRVYLCRIR